MNVFILDNDLQKSAEMLDDAHLRSQISEICQIITANYNLSQKRDCKIGHIDHTVTKWYNSREGCVFLINYGLSLCEEFDYRFNKEHQNYFTVKGFLHASIWYKLKNKDFVPATLISDNVMSTDIDANIRYYKSRLAEMKRKPLWTNREWCYEPKNNTLYQL